MIYIEPIGGLGNRMRTIDSIIPWCKKYNSDLTVLWNVDMYLNCPFDELFEQIQPDGVKFRVLNLNSDRLFSFKDGVLKIPKFGKRIIGINKQHKIFNDDLFEMYASKDYLNKVKLVSEVDEIFYPKVGTKLISLFEKKKKAIWIESCYRMHPHVDYYRNFVPVKSILEKINATVQKFDRTVGLHIRRSDHITSKEFSTTDKFVAIIHSCLKSDAATTFFVCTDSPEILQDLTSEFGDKIIYNKIDTYDRNDKQAIKDAVVDMYCLSRTQKIYGSYFSSFSQVAADIGRIEEVSVR